MLYFVGESKIIALTILASLRSSLRSPKTSKPRCNFKTTEVNNSILFLVLFVPDHSLAFVGGSYALAYPTASRAMSRGKASGIFSDAAL